MIRLLCLAAALVGPAGCGLIDADIAEVDLDLPPRTVIVDTADWELTDQGEMPAVACTETRRDCAPKVEMWCGADEICAAHCGGNTCEVNVLVALWHTVDLSQEIPDLAKVAGPLVDITVDRVGFAITENTLNMASPPLTVALGPTGAITADADGVRQIGTIPSLEPGESLAETEVELTADAEAAIVERLLDYETPFNLIVGSNVALRAGDAVPSGRLKARIRVKARARTGL
jgi:hypothetical protein